MPVHYILTDIEGTITSVSFVYEVLFPYFETHLQSFLQQNAHNTIIEECLQEVQNTVWQEEKRKLSKPEAAQQLLQWAKEDRKHTALKTLQGILWEIGYQRGEIKGHIYEDVPPLLQIWQNDGIKLGIYSSGSIKAQKLLLQTSLFGDLTPFFTHYFDTTIGQKKQAESYKNIQNILEVNPQHILFLSDVEAELQAAQNADFQVIQLVRENTQPSTHYPTAPNFEEVNRMIEEQNTEKN